MSQGIIDDKVQALANVVEMLLSMLAEHSSSQQYISFSVIKRNSGVYGCFIIEFVIFS